MTITTNYIIVIIIFNLITIFFMYNIYKNNINFRIVINFIFNFIILNNDITTFDITFIINIIIYIIKNINIILTIKVDNTNNNDKN